eukprot:TRINITY_DN87874_c0_g1_i1.p1 TRINITY_DN87874_c0_g1~~TRINITY_DN87874_c0_g1_i1.p1  ORF type:complete len:257 (+),score=32.37 TRINITY_DN87874_c0_g1_i1:25-795(+)
MKRIAPYWFALALLAWCVSGPFGAVFAAAPPHRSKDAHCILVSAPEGLVRSCCRSDGSALTSRVMATMVEWRAPSGTTLSEWQPPAGTELLKADEATSALSGSASQTSRMVATLVEYQPAVVEKQATSAALSGGASVDVAYVGLLAALVLAAAFLYNTLRRSSSKAGNPEPVAPAPPAVAAGGAAPAPSMGDALVTRFTPGQRVRLVYPPKMAGKEGTIVGPAGWAENDSFAVQLASGSIFYFATEHLQNAVPVRA